MRRFVFVFKWAACVIVLSSLLIHLPLVLRYTDAGFTGEAVTAYLHTARLLLSVFLLLFASMQITLVFHNESIRRAFRDHFRFLRRHGVILLQFMLIAGLHFYLLIFMNGVVLSGLGEATLAGVAWRLIYPLIWALMAAWLLSSWVCLFKRCEAGYTKVDKLVDY